MATGQSRAKAASRETGPLTSLYTFLPGQIPLIVIVRVTMWSVSLSVVVIAAVATFTSARPADGKYTFSLKINYPPAPERIM